MEEGLNENFRIVATAFIALTPAAVTAGSADAKKGKRVYNKCEACHALKAAKNKVGPSLHSIMGRKAAIEPKFKYSKAMRNSGLTWDEETLRKYLKKPRVFLKGTRIYFAGIKKKKDMDNLIAYLKKASN